MLLYKKIPFALLTSLVLMFSVLEFAYAQCAIEPIKPIPPLGCKDLKPQCATNSSGQSYWTWICVPDSGGADANEEREQQTPANVRAIPREPDQNIAHAAPVNPVEVAPQTHVPISEDSKPAVETLRTIARRIGECSEYTLTEFNWGRKKDEIVRLYDKSPNNLVWDVVEGNSVRAPYLGYVEFTLAEDYWVPDSARHRFTQSAAYLPILKHARGLWHYRFEYDLGPDGLQPTRVLLRVPENTTGEWKESADSLVKYCWGAAARNTQGSLPDHQVQ